jgi:hypothetical protein
MSRLSTNLAGNFDINVLLSIAAAAWRHAARLE